MASDSLPLGTRLWFAWVCFFRVLFDARFARGAWGVRAAELTAPAGPAAIGTGEAGKLLGVAAGSPEAVRAARAAEASVAPALRLLALLQREGRLVDFLEQDIASFPDADVGAAARVVHEGCRRTLRAHAKVEPVRPEAEGARVTLPAGFDADGVKLVGDVRGEPPYAGILKHRGWRASKLELPDTVGNHDERILAPAEVELG